MTGKRVTALLLALLLGLFFAPSALAAPKEKVPDQTLDDHPSGKDRTASPGKSGTQGKSTSDPDGMANGGPDKPGMTGGFDADKDGNNGCGNDDDFEDDNNGWCGHKPAPPAEVSAEMSVKTVSAETTAKTDVLAADFVRTTAPAVVMASTTTRSAATLAATGQDTALLVAFALVLCNLGACLLLAERRRLAPVSAVGLRAWERRTT